MYCSDEMLKWGQFQLDVESVLEILDFYLR